VASVFHLGRTGKSYFYAMEFVEGETLEDLLNRSGRLEVKLALEIATQVAAGLAAVHKQKLVRAEAYPYRPLKLSFRTPLEIKRKPNSHRRNYEIRSR
jgi:serine/threonine protein kinase